MWLANYLILILNLRCFVYGYKSSGSTEDGCLKFLPDDYRNLESPFSKEKPGNISFKFALYDLDEISETNMDLRIHGFLHMSWQDHRLYTSSPVLESSECLKYFWFPNLVFLNAKRVEEFQFNIFLVNGTKIFLSKRYVFRNSCRMHFKDYPFDTQKCFIDIATMFKDDTMGTIQWTDSSSVSVRGIIEPLQFYFMKPVLETCEKFVWNYKTNKTHLKIKLTLVRRLMGSIINIYLPSTLIVSVSWITFWLQLTATPARVSLSITSLLTLFTQIQQVKNNLPPLTYITAVDIWGFVCLFMVFGTLVEFAICYSAYKEEEMDPKTSADARSFKLIPWSTSLEDNRRNSARVLRTPTKLSALRKCLGLHSLSNTNQVDSFCRKLFPGVFLVFCLIYWGYYMSRYQSSLL